MADKRAQIAAEIKQIRDEGFKEGLTAGRKEALDWLEWAYLTDPGRPDRGTAKAEAILEVTQGLMKHIRSKGFTA